jgi:replicative DNA helicase
MYKELKKSYREHGVIEPAVCDDIMQKLIVELSDSDYYPRDIVPVIAELRKHYQARELVRLCSQALCRVSGEPLAVSEYISELQSSLTKLAVENSKAKVYDHNESVTSFVGALAEGLSKERGIRGHASHLPDLDTVISGWEHGRGYIVSGLEKLGKSRFVRNIVSTFLNKGLTGLIFQLEEDANSIHECVIAARCQIDTDIMGTSNLSGSQLALAQKAAAEYAQQHLYICEETGITPEYARSIIQSVKVKYANIGVPLDFVVWDHLLLMHSSGKTDWERAQEISKQWSAIGKSENLINIGILQMSSETEKLTKEQKNNSGPWAFLRFGKVFREAADCIMVLDNPERAGGEKLSDSGKGGPEQEHLSFLPSDSNAKRLIAHVLQRRGISAARIPIRAQLQFSRFYNLTK